MEVNSESFVQLYDLNTAPHYLSSLVGSLCLILLMPVPGYVTKLRQGVQRKKMKKVRTFGLSLPHAAKRP